MTDQEKVRKGIAFCLSRFHCGEDCPYYNAGKTGCMESLQKDTLELLNEQETVKPVKTWDTYLCGNCNRNVYHEERQGCLVLYEERYTYCPNCGRMVKWG